MAESLGSQASDAAAKAASDAENVNNAAAEVADTATDAAAQTKQAVEGAADAAKVAGDAATAATNAAKPMATATAAGGVAKAAGVAAGTTAAGTAAKAAGAVAKPAGVATTGAGTKSATPGAAKPAGASASAGAAKPVTATGAKPPAEVVAPSPPRGVARREFLNYVWGAAIALFLVQFGGITFFFAMPRFRAGEFGGTISVPADSFPQVNAAPVANNPGKFWLVQSDAGINTLYKVCTHLGCIYPWNEAAGIFQCPCHGSQFQLNGNWIAGPAPRNLDRFTFTVLDAGGNQIAASTDGNAIPMPAGAASVLVNTGQKILGQSHF